jgi:hypothetical protein
LLGGGDLLGIDRQLTEVVALAEALVAGGEALVLPGQPVVITPAEEDRNQLAAAGQLDRLADLGLFDEVGQLAAGLGDGMLQGQRMLLLYI